MKYWSYFAAKVLVASGVTYWLHHAVQFAFPVPPHTRYGPPPPMFLNDMAFTFSILLVWLVATGIFYLAIWDQRRRCRTCLRRLRMPIAIGSWSNILIFGRPKTQWICPYGHGTLKVDELHLDGKEPPDWEPHEDMWKELESLSSTRE
jgi:hypothetical protein